MLTVSNAVKKLILQARPVAADRRRAGIESIDIQQALGRVLATDIRSSIDVPPANNSGMDGYAFCAADAIAVGQGSAQVGETMAQSPPIVQHQQQLILLTGAKQDAASQCKQLQGPEHQREGQQQQAP